MGSRKLQWPTLIGLFSVHRKPENYEQMIHAGTHFKGDLESPIFQFSQTIELSYDFSLEVDYLAHV